MNWNRSYWISYHYPRRQKANWFHWHAVCYVYTIRMVSARFVHAHTHKQYTHTCNAQQSRSHAHTHIHENVLTSVWTATATHHVRTTFGLSSAIRMCVWVSVSLFVLDEGEMPFGYARSQHRQTDYQRELCIFIRVILSSGNLSTIYVARPEHCTWASLLFGWCSTIATNSSEHQYYAHAWTQTH